MTVSYRRPDGEQFKAVDDVSFDLPPNQAVGLIGESGSGKSTVARLLLGLVAADSGQVIFRGKDVRFAGRDLARYRRQVGVVFQEPFESLNPAMTVRELVGEPLKVQRSGRGTAGSPSSISDVLSLVGIPAALSDRYPGDLSGGQQQRVGIARAIVNDPALLVLDEPTSSLDVSTRAQILNLLQRIKETLSISYLFISHDMETVAHLCDQIYVMYRGRVVEHGRVSDVLDNPLHPYTQALIAARDPHGAGVGTRLLPDLVGSGVTAPAGCVLEPRCPYREESCRNGVVNLSDAGLEHQVACIKFREIAEVRNRSSL
ncbi:ABC transporter ATP-binding protein [Nocardioides sp. AE5]|uniref:ABC transporter ATP-binding protein n=1 Tax=Nocardioides sp. AE5 TaxID=2962573 RepID=UPI0028819E38|nr:ABC transporter ATP-binding protein [Nocardioides sp. AE5]MDT0202478.1 ABC transporter ATP-binding protein [Nocardioides sp. AE5]